MMPDIHLVVFRGGDQCGHITHIAEMIFLAKQLTNDHGPLQADLEFRRRALRQDAFFQSFLAVDHDAGPGFSVVGLVADHQD